MQVGNRRQQTQAQPPPSAFAAFVVTKPALGQPQTKVTRAERLITVCRTPALVRLKKCRGCGTHLGIDQTTFLKELSHDIHLLAIPCSGLLHGQGWC